MMKTRNVYLVIMLLSIVTWSCSKTDDAKLSSTSGSLKSSIQNNVNELTTAMNVIKQSPGYQVFENDVYAKSATESPVDSLLTNQILLTDIYGVYDYKMPSLKRGPILSQRFFNLTANSSAMIVSLPIEKVKNWKTMLTYNPKDTSLVNNYVINISEYMYKFRPFVGFDYKMASAIKIKDVDAGTLKIQNSSNRISGTSYSSEFVYANGYVTKCTFTSGDTAVSNYSISDGTKTLYEEKFTTIKHNLEKKHREKEFSLTLGNVQIIRKMGETLDSAKVYVGGVLQLNAKVEIKDVVETTTTDVTEATVTNSKRELIITFDDGTSSSIKELAGAAITDIRSMFTSMRQVYFATNVVDWIAWDVYKSKK